MPQKHLFKIKEYQNETSLRILSWWTLKFKSTDAKCNEKSPSDESEVNQPGQVLPNQLLLPTW